MSATKFEGHRYEDGAGRTVSDELVEEAPLQVKINGEAFTTTMRTPDADDRALALGLVFTEGILTSEGIQPAVSSVNDPETGITACLELTIPAEHLAPDFATRRALVSSSSCGVCGTRDVKDIEIFGPPVGRPGEFSLDAAAIPGLMERFRGSQRLFERTGGSHAAGIFDGKTDLIALGEDIGRHNAVDKAIGKLLAAGRLDDARIMVVSGRVSYEIVYKTYRAHIPVLLAVSAPSSMAVETCARMGITLGAWCRGGRATVYTHAERIHGAPVA